MESFPGRTRAKTYDVREVIARLVDGSELGRVQAGSTAKTLVTGFRPAIWGYPVGHRGQQRHPVLGEARSKARTSFELCSARRIPLIFLAEQTSPLSWVGKKYEGRRHSGKGRRQDGDCGGPARPVPEIPPS